MTALTFTTHEKNASFDQFISQHKVFHFQKKDKGFSGDLHFFPIAFGGCLCGICCDVGLSAIFPLIVFIIGIALVIFGFYSLGADIYHDRKEKEAKADEAIYKNLSQREKALLVSALESKLQEQRNVEHSSLFRRCYGLFMKYVYVPNDYCGFLSDERITKIRSFQVAVTQETR